MKKMKILLFVLLAVGLLFGYNQYKKMKQPDIDGGDLSNGSLFVSISYYHGGSSIGDLYSIDLDYKTISVRECEAAGYPIVNSQYPVQQSLVDELNKLIESYKVGTWVNLPQSDLIALDGPSTSFSVKFSNGIEITVSDRDVLPEDAYGAVSEIVKIIEDYIKSIK